MNINFDLALTIYFYKIQFTIFIIMPILKPLILNLNHKFISIKIYSTPYYILSYLLYN
jgi:hypothetical protein